ncbi:hypothetical protein G5714_001326 [Onychostoma macrolepis]|uniref:Uncharacterized protein n=1 Tax=Onychostoma macrolepis TaxID=369639 RepID=A0A7J6DBT9_9TELE|nr:hypothetical protein G5714_001326 [Onychostoma macrolepis]
MREGLESQGERLRTSTPMPQTRQRERERAAHEVEPRLKGGGAKDHNGEEKIENYQAGEPEDTPERTATPADSVQEALDEMEERPNKMKERIKETLDSLKRELDELEGGCELMQPHPSPHDCVQRKQYKQVAGTLVMQDLEYADDRFQVLQTQRQRGEEEHRSTRALSRAETPKFECPILIKQGHAQYIP